MEPVARAAMLEANRQTAAVRSEAKAALLAADPRAKTKDSDYVFITFILGKLPHGLIGLLIAVIFAAALNSLAAELTALSTTTTIDFWRYFRPLAAADEARNVRVARWFTALWGFAGVAFALLAGFAENLIEAVNIVGSIFYGVVLGIFLVAFFFRRVGGSAVFFAAVAAQCPCDHYVLVSQHRLSLVQPHRLRGVHRLQHAAADGPGAVRSRRSRPCGMSVEPIIAFGQQPCGFFPRRFLVAKIQTARRLQAEMGGRIVFFCHDSDHDPRETRTILRRRTTGEPEKFNFAVVTKLQRKFSPLYVKRIAADWQGKTLRRLPNYLDRRGNRPVPEDVRGDGRGLLSRDVSPYGVARRDSTSRVRAIQRCDAARAT